MSYKIQNKTFILASALCLAKWGFFFFLLACLLNAPLEGTYQITFTNGRQIFNYPLILFPLEKLERETGLLNINKSN